MSPSQMFSVHLFPFPWYTLSKMKKYYGISLRRAVHAIEIDYLRVFPPLSSRHLLSQIVR